MPAWYSPRFPGVLPISFSDDSTGPGLWEVPVSFSGLEVPGLGAERAGGKDLGLRRLVVVRGAEAAHPLLAALMLIEEADEAEPELLHLLHRRAKLF